ncbi:hypothetical protein ACQ4M3_31725 [Leptolyngbya sp. AN03gr2]|uniref:hypothetical protein n=1 Tax=unclassified Leptolyngbya TaxID=2650499 RepID=UPI003D3147C4
MYIPDLAKSRENQLGAVLPGFFHQGNLWLDASGFILSYLKHWYTNPKLARAVMREFQPVLVSPSGFIQANQIKTFQQAEDFMIGVAACRVMSKLSEELKISRLSIEELEELLGITKSAFASEEYNSTQIFSNSDSLFLIEESVEPLSAVDICSKIEIKHNKDKNKKNKNKQIQNLLRHLPEDIAVVKLNCPECSGQFKPNWFKLSNEPHIPVKPNNYDGAGRWVPMKTYEMCPFCEEFVPLDFPTVQMQSKVMLFGDEAYREERGNLVFTYSLVGADFKMISKVEETLRNLKLELCPSETPDSWVFHMKELWSGDQRKKHRVLCNWNFEKVQLAVHLLFQLIRSHADYLFMYNIALTTKGSMKGFKSKSALDRPQDNAYILLVSHVIHELTTAKGQPILQFDAEKRTQTDKVIQAWARDAFSGSQHCLLYPFLAKGIEVPEPIFVQPASHSCLELADFISYIIARSYQKRWQGQEIEEILNPCNLGRVRYLGFDTTGDLVFDSTESYPWEFFYGSRTKT